MELTIAFLFLGVVASHAAIPPELYWNSVLPNTPMPGAIRSTLSQGMGKSDIIVHGAWTDINLNQCNPKANNNPEDDLSNPNAHLYLLEKDLVAGNQMVLNFTTSPNAATFWPREVADSIPFSLNKLPEILNKFSLKPESKQAGVIKATLQDCEDSQIEGGDFCATSLESMIDYNILRLGKQVRAISTEVPNETVKQKYTFTPELRMIGSSKIITCHKENYAYAVYFCHEVPSTNAYMVPLVGVDGSKAKAVAVCHKNTSSWSPESVPFKVLNVKPGTTICHLLFGDVVLWVPTN